MQNAALFSAVGAYFFANRALAVGSLNFAYGLGGFIGPLLGSHLTTSVGAWQAPFYLFGAIGLVFVVVIALVMKRKFTEQVDVPVSAAGSRDFDHVPANLFNRNMLLLGVAAVVVGVAMYGYIGLYPTFLREQLGFSTGQAGFAASMFGLGALLGIPAGWIGDRFNQRNIMIGSLLVGCVVG